jgi:hypothetical protein
MGNAAYEARRVAEEGAKQAEADEQAEFALFVTAMMKAMRDFVEGRASIVMWPMNAGIESGGYDVRFKMDEQQRDTNDSI